MKLTVTENTFDLHPADEWIDAELTAIEEEEGQFGPRLKFVFTLEGEEDRDQFAWCSPKLSPKSVLYGWVKGLNGGTAPGAGDVVDLNTYLGADCQVMFEHYTRDDGTERDKVVKVRAKGKTSGKAKAGKGKPAPKPQTDDDESLPF